LEAFPDRPLTADVILEIAQSLTATPVFNDQAAESDLPQTTDPDPDPCT
jgi:hypothetical protein